MASPVEPGVKVGWLNRHTPTNGFFSSKQQGYHWKLVKSCLMNGQLAVSSAQSLGIRAFDPSLEPQTAPSASPLVSGVANLALDHPSNPLPKLQDVRLSHKSSEPHPELVLDPETHEVVDGSCEALCHYVLFSTAEHDTLAAIIITLPFYGSLSTNLAILKEYCDLVASRQLGDPNSALASRVQLVIHTLIDATPGMVLNQSSHLGLQELAISLGTVDEQTSTALKLEIYKCHESLTNVLKGPQQASFGGSLNPHILERAQQLQSLPDLLVPPELFLDSEFIDALAHQIAHYHRFLWQQWSPLVDVSLIFHRSNDPNTAWQHNALMFDLTTPHFLGRILLNHIINSKLQAPQRGSLIQQWILLGAKLHQLGDIVGWVAIVTTMCRTPILRLKDTWAYVDPELRAKVSNEWALEAFELEKRSKMDLLAKTTFRASTDDMGEVYPKSWCVPYFGDIIVSTVGKFDFQQVRQIIDRASGVVDGWHYYFENAPDMENPPPDVPVEPIFQQLLSRWAKLAPSSPDLLLSLEAASLSIEPKILGHYLNYHYNQTLPLSNGSFLPVMFTEVCPSFKLFSRTSLMTAASSYGRGSSQASPFLRSPNPGAATEPRNGSRSNISSPIPMRRPLPTRSNSFPPPTTGNRELEIGTREHMMENQSGHVLVKNIRDLLNMGIKTHAVDSNLVFKSFEEERHGSRTSSIIENLGRRSMMFDNNRLSIQSLELARLSQEQSTRPLNIVVKAASLPRLVDVLVLGTTEFTPPGSNFSFKLDLPLHTETFFATFRSFCSPLELLSMIRTRFQAASGAAMSILNRSNDPNEPFPQWKVYSDDVLQNPQVVGIMSQIYTNILEAIQFWESKHFVDFSADSMLRNNTTALLSDILDRTSEPVFSDGLQDLARRVYAFFTKQCFQIASPLPQHRVIPKPVGRHLVPLMAGQQLQPSNESLVPLEKYLEELDMLVADVLSRVALQDWMQLFEALELQVSDTTALFNYSWSSYTNEDALHVGNIYTYLATLYRTSPDHLFITTLPPAIQELLKLHRGMADYFCHQVSDPMLHLTGQDRVQRMAVILKMLGILRTRMRFLDLFPDAKNDRISRVPSFLETAIIDGILRPESRAYNIAWLNAGARVATDFGGFDPQLDDLPNACTLFIPNIPIERLSSKTDHIEPISPCVGWIIERLLEIVCYIPNMAVDTPELINFDKRRYAFNLVKNLQTEILCGNSFDEEMLVKLYAQYDYIVNPDARLYQWDRKAIKEAASRETIGVSKTMLKQRVFTTYISTEQAKLKAEQRQYDVFVETQSAMPRSASAYALRERRQSRIVRPLSTINSGPPGNPPSNSAGSTHSSGSLSKASRSSRLGGFLRAVRPLSMAFSSSTGTISPSNSGTPTLSQSFTSGSLNFVPAASLPDISAVEEAQFKQVLLLDMADWLPKGPGREHTIRLVASNGSSTEHVFQAPNDKDAQQWLVELEKSHRAALAYRMSQPGSSQVFGVPLEIVAAREKRNVPLVVEKLLSHIDKYGLEDVGLYRISGSVGAINSLKQAFDRGEDVSEDDERMADVNAVAGCVKLYLRELPESLLTQALFGQFIWCGSVTPESARVDTLKKVIQQLPAPNYAVLRRLMRHLARVVEHEELNRMSVPNLAIVFSMNFLPPTEVDGMKAMQSIVKTMIQSERELFDS